MRHNSKDYISKVNKYDIHPITIKQVNKGHPWILADRFTEKFNPRERFIVALNNKRPFALFLHDPRHPHVKARLWSKQGNFDKQVRSFKTDLATRIHEAILHRRDLKVLEQRQNIYLVFGEADKLPGINIQLLENQLLFQFYGNFWENYQAHIIETTIASVRKLLKKPVDKEGVWVQMRETGEKNQKYPKGLNPNVTQKEFIVEEFGVNYQLQLGNRYDIGIYTDMASIRNDLTKEFEQAKKVLNLYAYTGAFSLYAMKHNPEKVVSVDLSKKYLDQLEYNIKLNSELKNNHESICKPSLKALESFDDEQFDLIICDPPSSSNDGKRRSNALKDYQQLIPQMMRTLKKNGKMVIFLNTHRTPRNKFEQKIKQILNTPNCKSLQIVKKLRLTSDCPTLKGFPEGDYLKGLVLQKND